MPRSGAQRGFAWTILAATLIATALFLALFGLTQWSLHTGRSALATPINTAFADKALEAEASWLHGDTGIGAHQYVDCLILFQVLDDRAPAAERAVSPLTVPVDTDNACAVLADFAAGRTDPQVRPYHQYLHAHTTVARLLIPSLGVAGLRGIYKLALTLTLLAGLGYALLGLARGTRMSVHAAWLIIFLTFSRWFGLESFGQSLSHGPADLILFVFLLFLQRASVTAPLAPRTAIAASAIFGALTMQFEFLTGGLPLGLALVIGALPLALSCGNDMAAIIIRSVVAYVTAAVATVLARLVLILLTFGPGTFIDLGKQFLFRTGLARAVRRDTPVDWDEYFSHVWAGLEALTPGMHLMALGTLVLATVAGGWGYGRLRRAADEGERLRAVALLGSMLVPPLWMVIFWQHTAEHAWFMDRILAWIIAAGGVLFVFALAPGMKAQSR